MNSQETANKLVALCRAGKNLDAINTLYSPDIVSLEAYDMGEMKRESRGIEAVRGKNKWWLDAHQVNAANVSDPFCAVDKFSVIFDYDVTVKATGKNMKMKEVAVYTLENGKIVREEFLYNMA